MRLTPNVILRREDAEGSQNASIEILRRASPAQNDVKDTHGKF
jgi:hypothetical protein